MSHNKTKPSVIRSIVLAYQAGKTIDECCELHHVSKNVVSKAIREAGIARRPGPKKSVVPRQHAKRLKLTDALREKVRELRGCGMTLQAIAIECGCSLTTVWNILHRGGAE